MDKINNKMDIDYKEYIDSYIKQALTVNTDEIEGLLVIELTKLNLCALDQEYSYTNDDNILNIDNIINNFPDEDTEKLLSADIDDISSIINDIHIDNRIIIEFALATISDPNPVQYTISVNPGESINNETILGTVILNGKEKLIKSIFSKGTVMSENNDYYKIFPDTCNRHIILTDCISGNGTSLDVSILENINDIFTEEGYLYSLITNNLALSLLPYILSHRIRGIFKRQTFLGTNNEIINGKWYFKDENSDLSYDTSIEDLSYISNKNFVSSKLLDYPYIVYDYINEEADNGVTIFDSSVLSILNDLQDEFGANIIGNDITSDDMKKWKKRAKKKKNRKKVKKEIIEKVENNSNKYKTENPLSVMEEEKNRLLNAREQYINSIIDLYESRESLPLCKYDEEYNDCKFLVNDDIDKNVLKQVKKYDDEFSYTGIGDSEEYYNYYLSLLSNINILNDNDKYSQEYYNIITDIINKRLIVEKTDISKLKENFCILYNENIKNIFSLNKDKKKNSIQKIETEFNKLELNISNYSSENNYTDLTLYMQIYNYINSELDTEEDSDDSNIAVTQLSTMYSYIKSYGNGDNNPYKDLVINNKYIYLDLVIEESNKLCDFWNNVISLYRLNNMNNCIETLYNTANSFEDVAQWPAPTEIEIDNIIYKHYLFENIYNKDIEDDEPLNVEDYKFPDHIDFPEIPEDVSVDEQWALELLNNYDFVDFDNPHVISIKDFKYWQRYFSLATLICLPPIYWNCGLDIFPFIQLIPLPCIFIAINCVYIRLFGIIIVFGIAIRGMYPWPIILYVNTTNQPISILTPLLVVIQLIKDTINQKLLDLEKVLITEFSKALITLLEHDSNNLKKENKKLDTYILVCKTMNIPKAESIKKTFELVADPSIDTRLKILRLETITRMNRVY